MNAQLEFPLARSTDPDTSWAAAESVAPKVKGQCDTVLRFLRGHPLCTALELASYFHARHPDSPFPEFFRKRLPILRRDRKVRNGLARRCRVSGETAQTWEAV